MWFKLALSALVVSGAQPATAATISIQVGNVRNIRGHVRVDICDKDRFLKNDCPYSGHAPAHPGTTIVTIAHVPAGTYAVQAFHDENDDGRVDRALFGIPKEGVGFSNNAPIRIGPPKWEAARFTVMGDMQLSLNMRYFLGPAGPAR